MTENSLSSLSLKENMEREAKEAARHRRIQKLEEQKRHSWAGGEEVGGLTYNQTFKIHTYFLTKTLL